MSDSPQSIPPAADTSKEPLREPQTPPADSPPPPAPTSHSPVKRIPKAPAWILQSIQESPRKDQEGPRRDFFGDAMKEALGPFAGLIERKINPILAALEALPSDVERLTNVTLPALERTLDQRHGSALPAPANWPLDPPSALPLTLLRPPGALPPGEFENVCSRCGKCVEVCPASAIKIDSHQLIADGLPYITAREQPCVVCDTLACMKECPSGALKLVDRLAIHMGTAHVDRYQCRRDTGEDCRICVEACPVTGDGAREGLDAIFIHAESGRVRVRKTACLGCGLCENRCPTEPAAIRVEPFKRRVDPIVA